MSEDESRTAVLFGQEVLRHEGNAVLACASALNQSFSFVVEVILNATHRVVTCGVGKSGHIARKAAATFSSTGTPALFLHASEAVHGDLGSVGGGDTVIFFSQSGETEEILRLFPSVRDLGASSVLVTGRPQSEGARQADYVLDTGVKEEACPILLAPTTSTTVMLALSDALALTVMERRGFGRDDFARYHPSGSLGKRLLLRVRDVMRPNYDVAIVGPDQPVLDVIRAMTELHVGAACVADELKFLGLVSESDLRRHLLKNPPSLDTPVKEIMNRRATTVRSEIMATEAFEIFQSHPAKIGEIPVVEEGEILGLLVLKDLLRSGIL